MSQSETVRLPTDEVREYVQAVQAALTGLTPDEVEDLTGGMEADLEELLRERGGPLREALGTPEAYAVELRQAAGLPEPGETSSPRRIDLGQWWSGQVARLAETRQRTPSLRATWEFLVAIRPAWWVVRGLVAAWIGLNILVGGATLVPHSVPAWLTAVLAIVGSVALGRGLWASYPTRVLVAIGNVIAVPALLLGIASMPSDTISYANQGVSASTGLALNGQQIANVYAYDANGKRLTDVRLFGDDGQALVIDRWDNTTATWMAGRKDVYGTKWKNVFPIPYALGADPWAAPSENTGRQWWSPPPSVAPLAPQATTPSGTASTTAPATPQNATTINPPPGPSPASTSATSR